MRLAPRLPLTRGVLGIRRFKNLSADLALKPCIAHPNLMDSVWRTRSSNLEFPLTVSKFNLYSVGEGGRLLQKDVGVPLTSPLLEFSLKLDFKKSFSLWMSEYVLSLLIETVKWLGRYPRLPSKRRSHFR